MTDPKELITKLGQNQAIKAPKRRIRSDIERRRMRMDELENYFERMRSNLEYYARLDINGIAPFYEYLNWVKLKLQEFETVKLEDESQLTHKIRYFEESLKSATHYYNSLNDSYTQKSHEKPLWNSSYTGYTLKQPTFEYSRFLENGIRVFITIIDVYQLWLKPSEIVPIISKKVPDTLSYAFIAILARFTIPAKNPNFKSIFGTAIKNARKTLPNAYKTPSVENVIALGLMTHLALVRFNIKLVIKYFSGAIRMAQLLGLDKEDYNASNSKNEGTSNVWKGLSLTYLILSTVIPNFPIFNIKLEAFELELPKEPLGFGSDINLDYNNSLKMIKPFSNEVNKKLTEIFMILTLRIQKIKLKNSFEDPSLIPNQLLRLPSKEFNECITTLMSIQKYFVDNNSKIAGSPSEQDSFTAVSDVLLIPEDSFTFNKRFRAIYESLFIYLYCPKILVHPQPVNLTLDELRIIHCSANRITYYLLGAFYTKSDNYNHNTSLILSDDQKNICDLIYESPHYLQAMCPIYIYFNLLHHYITNPTIYPTNSIMKREAIDNSFVLIKALHDGSKSSVKAYFEDSTIALNQLKESIPRFTLPIDLKEKINTFFV